MGNAYTTEVRAVLCSRCGAPITLSAADNVFQCKYCGASGTVDVRRDPATQAVVPSAQEEAARMARLRMQYEMGSAGNPYAGFMPPPDVAYLASLRPPQSVGPWFEAWKQAVVLLRASGTPLDQLRVLWLARSVSAVYLLLVYADPWKSRAVLETALDLLPDPAHQHLLRCQLSALATSAGDVDSAWRWLACCDPYPTNLTLDTTYRLAVMKIYLMQSNWQAVLQWLGREPREIPIDPSHAHMAGLYQVHAWDGLGYAAVADAQLDMWIGDEARTAPGCIAAVLEAHRWLQLCAKPLARRLARR
jgi:hypothetical protein